MAKHYMKNRQRMPEAGCNVIAPKQHDMLRKGRNNAGFSKGTVLTVFTMPDGSTIMIPKSTRKRGSKFNGGMY